ncbi:hypothetical protein AALO_G00223990 [Alosa alosa]|uniref:Ubiquitin-like protease family profile domain-containing protein n=1 Tax=Alosa alosa TaxID=278164 RepID=A0AAV6G4T1_9TELE|nr:hypothetical protein AALO_G00223990 [Alosa alosa]
MMWAAEDQDQVEAVVGPYTLYDSSFRTLHGNEWLSDEVIDAYLHLLTGKQQKHVHHLSAVVATALFSGQLQKLGKMKFPVENLWLCPVNVGAHWILVFILPPALEDYARPSDQIAEQTAYQNGASGTIILLAATQPVKSVNSDKVESVSKVAYYGEETDSLKRARRGDGTRNNQMDI